MKLASLRKEIDKTDWQILQLLARRLKLAENIGRYKKKNRLPVNLILNESRRVQNIE